MNPNSLSFILSQTAHRPWALPKAKPFMIQYWEDLAFLHWEIPLGFLEEVLPKGLSADTHQGKAYIGLVPFRMKGVRPTYLPPLPWLSTFPELNVRTYVQAQDKPGVYFFSLDASNPLVVEIARKFFHLPYLNADMTLQRKNIQKTFYSNRTDSRAAPARFHAVYQPISEPYRSRPGTLEHWLTERYCLYCKDSSERIYRAEVHHLPWSLQKGECKIYENTILQSHRISVLQTEPLIHYSHSLKVALYPMLRLS
ncbi:YqjF family protein [Leptospira yasudae]|uniref:DUF2071 domain-containing protein n=1 Tax=Leptospira yasudae TaxID=2202201 RepID=A0A6N4QZR2_9LEPT|nr:DUF2071 domain-containing protein [Leptospira yasudae]TGL77070.1 DUF2071 domain-containing protein [Leptospira yasudae]TGL79554.1 DUF2071 domain-containing protein [Leptospira yasudae]TGL84804.1 DUF2071 domain-containing protein [Leptospira yasudae]